MKTTKCNNCKSITYNPEIMWFDYPALFEQRRQWILNNFLGSTKEYKKYKIKHTNLKVKSLARDAIINGDVDDNIISSALNGEYSSLVKIIENIKKYMTNFKYDSDIHSINNSMNNRFILQYNYRCLLAIIVQFAGVREKLYRNEYSNLVQQIPLNFYMQEKNSINEVQFDTIVQPLLETITKD